MPIDGITLSFVRNELEQMLRGGRVDKVTQPERDEIAIQLRSLGRNRILLISIDPSCARVHVTENKKVSPLEPSNFCMLMRKHLQGGRLMAVRQIDGDRIIEIDIENRDDLGDICTRTMVIELMGRHSNLILVNHSGRIIDSLRHVSEDVSRVREVLPGLPYERPPKQDKLSPIDIDADALAARLEQCSGKIAKAYADNITGMSIQAAREFAYRACGEEDAYTIARTAPELAASAVNILSSMHGWVKPAILLNDDGQPQDFTAFPYLCRAHMPQQAYPTLSEMLDEFYEKRDLAGRITQKSAALQRILRNNIERCEKKLGLQLDALRDSQSMDDYRIKGELIMAQLGSVRKGADKVQLMNYYAEDNAPLTVELDVRLSPADNAQHYFKLYQKARSAQKLAAEQLEKTQAELYYLESQWDNLQKCTDESELNEIRLELEQQGYVRANHNRRTMKKLPPSQPYHYIAPDGTSILVGKNNVQNDLLTRTAELSDTWLHVKDMPGSHVIVCSNAPSDETLKVAANLAAYYSKGKTGSQVPVDYTLRKYVKKPSGAKPGFVIYTHQATLYTTPDEKLVENTKKAES